MPGEVSLSYHLSTLIVINQSFFYCRRFCQLVQKIAAPYGPSYMFFSTTTAITVATAATYIPLYALM